MAGPVKQPCLRASCRARTAALANPRVLATVQVSLESSHPGPSIPVALAPLRGSVGSLPGDKSTTSGLVGPLPVGAAGTRARSTPLVEPVPKTPRSPKSLSAGENLKVPFSLDPDPCNVSYAVVFSEIIYFQVRCLGKRYKNETLCFICYIF